jgi:hypothetical protein
VEINNTRDLLTAYFRNLSAMQKLCEQTLAIAAAAGDSQMAGYCYLIVIQIKTLTEGVKVLLGGSPEENEAEDEEEKSYDLIDLWKHMGGDSE